MFVIHIFVIILCECCYGGVEASFFVYNLDKGSSKL
jgi:hypothetical protein